MAIELYVGLAPSRNGFYDKKTGINLSGSHRHQRLVLEDGTDLQGLARGLFTMVPAIVLYEGEFPEAEKVKFLENYNYKLAVIDRAARIISHTPPVEGAEVTPQSLGEAKLLNVETGEQGLQTSEEDKEAEAETEAPKTSRKRTATK